MNKQYLISGVVLIIAIAAVALAFVLLQNDTSEDQTYNVTKEPFLWRIEGENPSYLYGSIHLADEDILTLPDVVIEAVDDVDVVYTEVKLDIETQTRSAELSMLSGGETLADLLPQDVIDSLDSYLAPMGINHTAFSQFKIWAVATTLVLLEEIENLLEYPPLDQYIWNLATSKGKETGGIETVEEQIGIFDNFTIAEQIEMLSNALDSLEEYASAGQSVTGETIDAYLQGDLEILQDLSLSDYDENDPFDVKFKSRILTDRNYNMTQRISQLLTDNPDTRYFFTIGAAHYYGDDGLITLLENEGYMITRVEFSECEPCDCDSGEVEIDNRCYVPYE